MPLWVSLPAVQELYLAAIGGGGVAQCVSLVSWLRFWSERGRSIPAACSVSKTDLITIFLDTMRGADGADAYELSLANFCSCLIAVADRLSMVSIPSSPGRTAASLAPSTGLLSAMSSLTKSLLQSHESLQVPAVSAHPAAAAAASAAAAAPSMAPVRRCSNDGKKHGPCKEFDETGILLFDGCYSKGKRHGPCKEFHSNGVLKFEGSYEDGKKHGLFKEFDKTGLHLVCDGCYSTGKRHGPCQEFHANGALKFEGSHEDGKRHGPCKEFFCNGFLMFCGSYIRGRKVRVPTPWSTSRFHAQHVGEMALTSQLSFELSEPTEWLQINDYDDLDESDESEDDY